MLYLVTEQPTRLYCNKLGQSDNIFKRKKEKLEPNLQEGTNNQQFVADIIS